MNKEDIYNNIIEILQEVYDPDFPAIDIYNLWLIYDVIWNKENKQILIRMTLTSPACPSADLIMSMTEQAVSNEYPDYEILIDLTFEPLWNPSMIKDEDLKRMFE